MLNNVHCALFCRAEVTAPPFDATQCQTTRLTDIWTPMGFAHHHCFSLRRRFGVMPEARVAIVMFSAAFFESKACVDELVKICTEDDLSRCIIPVYVRSHTPPTPTNRPVADPQCGSTRFQI